MLKKSYLLGPSVVVVAGLLIYLFWTNSTRIAALQSASPTPTAWYDVLPTGEKRDMAIAAERTRLAALKTPQPAGVSKPIPTDSPIQLADIPSRPAGAGTIVESGQAPFPAYYVFQNMWYMKKGDRVIRVYAGAQRGDPQQGGKTLDKPWPGVLMIIASPGEEVQYLTPVKAGVVKIVDAVGERLVLNAEDGRAFYFDVPGRQFANSLTESVPTITPAASRSNP